MVTGLCASTGSTVLAKHTCNLCRVRYSWNAVTKGGEAVGCPIELVLSTAAVEQQPTDTPCEWVTRQSVSRRDSMTNSMKIELSCCGGLLLDSLDRNRKIYPGVANNDRCVTQDISEPSNAHQNRPGKSVGKVHMEENASSALRDAAGRLYQGISSLLS